MRQFFIRVLIVVSSVALCTYVAYRFAIQDKALPVYKPSNVNPKLVDPEVMRKSKHRIGPFQLIDQEGRTSSHLDLENDIYVADFFFTTCKTICPIMSSQMNRVAAQFKGQEGLQIRSFSVIPEEDTPEALNAYARAYNIDYDQWRLLTGDKEVIYDLARKSYFTLKKAEVGKGDGGDSDFIHTNNFVLVDYDKRIRGYYDGTSTEEVDELMDDIRNLLRERSREINP